MGYLDIEDETIKNVKYGNKDNAEAFNRDIIRRWLYQNPRDKQTQVSQYCNSVLGLDLHTHTHTHTIYHAISGGSRISGNGHESLFAVFSKTSSESVPFRSGGKPTVGVSAKNNCPFPK